MAVQCSNCSGKLIFNPASQKLECISCGSKFSPEDVEDKIAELHTKYYDTRVYICSHCGAEVITSDTEASTFCMYCGNPAIVFSRISKELKPDGLIPFHVTREEAVKNVKNHLKKNPFVPKEVKAKVTPDNLRGIYVPYWVINASYTEADMISSEIRRGKHTYKILNSRAGDVQFQNIPIDGSVTLNDDVSCKLEPFYFEEAKAFDEDYLNGFYSNTSDLSYTDLRNSAAHRCHKLFIDEVLKTIPGDKPKVEDSIYWVDIHDNPLYMMMPIWFLTFKYKGKPNTILINGQSGKVVGAMPPVKKKIAGLSILIFLLVLLFTGLLFLALINHNLIGFTKGLSQGTGLFISLFVAFSLVGLTRGFLVIRKVRKNLKLTQSEEIFKFVKKRQE